MKLFTVGHSNHTLEQFIKLLKAYDIQTLADIRSYPGSRKFPHFNKEQLSKSLSRNNIEYSWFQALGGRRHGKARNESPNTALRNPGFRNYADYMQTEEFESAAEHLMSIAATSRTAVMCAEKIYWRCHRRLLSDYLLAQGVQPVHILEEDRTYDHKLTAEAVIREDRVSYPSSKPPKPGSEDLFNT